MKSALRVGAVALALIATSYGVVTATHQPASAEPAPEPPAQELPAEVKTADTETLLPDGDFRDIVVDNTHQQVFVSMTNAVIVTDFDGAVTKTITDVRVSGHLTLGADSVSLYVVERGYASLAIVNTLTYEVTRAALPETHCPVSAAFTGGKVWYSYRTCGSYSGGAIGVYDPATGEAAGDVFAAEPGEIRALPDRPDRLFHMDGYSSAGTFHVYDVSATPTEVATGGGPFCDDAALTLDGGQAISACERVDRHRVHNTSDLSSASPIMSGGRPNSVAVSPDGNFVAAGAGVFDDGDAVLIQNIEGGAPGTAIRRYTFRYYSWLETKSLAFTDTGRLLAVTYDPNGSYRETLHVLHDATKYDTSITLKAPKAVAHQGAVNVTGTLNKGPGTETTLSLTRTDRTGTHTMDPVTAAADGTFRFTHTPGVTGPVTYQVSYPGDDERIATQASTTVIARPLPYDVNADGYAETVVGVPGEDIGPDVNTGMFHVLFGGPAGASGSGSKVYHQDTSGVPGSNEDGDQFGLANASGDFNGDGYADVAVSMNAEDIGSQQDAGMVLVFYGSASGLRTSGVTNLYIGNAPTFFGQSLAAGDFDGDGHDDLAVGGPGAESGYVFVYPGSSTGLSRANQQPFSQDTESVPGHPNQDDLFGWAVSTGDVNGDGYDELAVGAIYDWEDRGWSTGSATVLYGSASGLTGSGAQRLSKDTSGVPGQPRPFNPDKKDGPDNFGYQLQLADLNGDGRADLGVTASQAPVWVDSTRKRDAGTLTVMLSDGSRITGTGSQNVTQQRAGMPGTAGYEDHLGSTLTAGDSDGDGRADLAVYSPGDTYVTVVRGGPGGLVLSTAKGWTQNSAGIPGKSEPGDYWGASLQFADITGSGYHALIVGAEGENNYKGAITVIYSTSSGLTGTGSKYFSQNSTGIAGAPESGDAFGVFY